MPQTRKQLAPWQKIIRAGDRGTGVCLTADEVEQLRQDSAIISKAANDESYGYNKGAELLVIDF